MGSPGWINQCDVHEGLSGTFQLDDIIDSAKSCRLCALLSDAMHSLEKDPSSFWVNEGRQTEEPDLYWRSPDSPAESEGWELFTAPGSVKMHFP